jgi:putative methionine-R-sulfoxide reductase with GAF domain
MLSSLFVDMEGFQEFSGERRRCLRQRVHAPAFASFDGVSGGMILDLSEEGLSMQTGLYLEGHPLDSLGLGKGRRVQVEMDLPEPATRLTLSKLETTGYIAWADALGRAGVRFSELPEAARHRLNDWLAINSGAPSHTAPKVVLGWPRISGAGAKSDGRGDRNHFAISLEAEADAAENDTDGNWGERPASATMQYEFSSLGSDLTATLRLIGERARSLTRGTSAAIALVHKDSVMCRASVGESAPALGTRLNVNSGLSGECFREGRTLRCDDAEHDPRVDLESCRRLGVRSIVAAPVRYERDTVGLLMVLASEPFNFDEGDVAVVESLAHIVVRSMRQADAG